MRLLFLLTLATAFALAGAPVHATNLVTYPFSSNLNAEVQSGVTASSFSGSGSKAAIGLGSAGPLNDPYNNKQPYAYILIKENSTSASSAVSNSQYAQFTVTPPAKNGMQIGQIQVSAARAGTSSPRGLVLRWSFDGYSSNLGTANVTKTWTDTGTYTFNLNAFTGGSVTFRLYAYAQQTSQAEASVRLTNLVVIGDAVYYPPVVTPKSTNIKTAKTSAVLRGTAYDSSGIARVEVAKNNIKGVYSGANGTTTWNYTATGLKTGANVFYVRAVDRTGTVGPSVKITVRRSKSKPSPTPKPTP